MIRLVRTVLWYPYIISLFRCQGCKFHAQLVQVEAGYLLIQMFRQTVDLFFVVIFPELDLCQGLVGEGVAHHERRMTGCTAKVNQTAFSQQEDGMTIIEHIFVHLGFDIDPGWLFRIP